MVKCPQCEGDGFVEQVKETMMITILTGEYLVLTEACQASSNDGRAVVWPEGTRVRNVVTADKRTTFEAESSPGVWEPQLTFQSPENLVKWAGKLLVSHHEEEQDDEQEAASKKFVRCILVGGE